MKIRLQTLKQYNVIYDITKNIDLELKIGVGVLFLILSISFVVYIILIYKSKKLDKEKYENAYLDNKRIVKAIKELETVIKNESNSSQTKYYWEKMKKGLELIHYTNERIMEDFEEKYKIKISCFFFYLCSINTIVLFSYF